LSKALLLDENAEIGSVVEKETDPAFFGKNCSTNDKASNFTTGEVFRKGKNFTMTLKIVWGI
jgi:hypothetical protein